jgi:hypothetical protein
MNNENITLRDYFAAKAMQAIITTYAHANDFKDYSDEKVIDLINEDGWGGVSLQIAEIEGVTTHADYVACDAYFIADAMLAVSERTKPK